MDKKKIIFYEKNEILKLLYCYFDCYLLDINLFNHYDNKIYPIISIQDLFLCFTTYLLQKMDYLLFYIKVK